MNVTLRQPRTRYAAIVLIVALLASLAVAAFRARVESHARRVEIAMDFQDFDALARSYNYNPAAFLIALRDAITMMPEGGRILAITYAQGSRTGSLLP